MHQRLRTRDISTQERAASIGQTNKSMFDGSTAQEYLDLLEAEEETGDKRLVQLAEKAVKQKSERECVSASLVAAKARVPMC
jgi:hypothetical protein